MVWTLYGTQLSPFALKVAAALVEQGEEFQWVWQHGTVARLWFEARLALVRAGLLRLHVPRPPLDLDELPLVPFLFKDDGTNAMDSTAILREIGVDSGLGPELGFLSGLLEEFFDEWGLYLVHHKRWSDPANAGVRGFPLEETPGGFLVLHEMIGQVWVPQVARPKMAKWFNRRQTRRKQYLFSGPQTDGLLDASFEAVLRACEAALGSAQGPSLLGALGVDHRTAADLACFGQLNMLAALDRGSRAHMESVAPKLVAWLDGLQHDIQDHTRQPRFAASATPAARPPAPPYTPPDQGAQLDGLRALLGEVATSFAPLMRANAHAYELLVHGGQTVFNEAAFERGCSGFQVELRGQPVQTVAKTFQVGVWRKLALEWRLLGEAGRDTLCARLDFDLGSVMLAPFTCKLVAPKATSKI